MSDIGTVLKDLIAEVRRNFKDIYHRIVQLEMAGGQQHSGGGGAPGDAEYLVLALDADLSEERRFVLAGGASAVDGGADGDYTVTVHDAVTLAADADTVLNLTGQEIGLDVQVANTVFSGPVAGAPADPTFRALVAADIPAIPVVVIEGPGIDVVGGDTVGLGGDTILLYDSGGLPCAEYAASDAGLIAALAAMGASDVVELPDVTIAGGPWTVANGTLRGHSRWGSVLDGLVTVQAGAKIERLSIIRSEDEADPVVGIILEEDGRAEGCFISVTNAGGDVYGIFSDQAGNCYSEGNLFYLSASGIAYGFYADGATMYCTGGGFVPDTTYIPVGSA